MTARGCASCQLVADDLVRVDGDGPGVDRSRERLSRPVDDIAALGDQARQACLPAGRIVAESGKPQDPRARSGRTRFRHRPASQHQPLMINREHLPSLTDESKPLGPDATRAGDGAFIGAG